MRNIVFGALLACLLASCNDENRVIVKGDIQNASKKKVYLEQLNVDKAVIVDSARTNRKGHFSFKMEVTDPTFYAVRVGDKESVTFIAEPGKEIVINGCLENLSGNYQVDGSESSLWIKVLNFQLNRTKKALDSLQKIYAALPAGSQYNPKREQLQRDWDSTAMRQIEFSRNFIIQHAMSPASYYALYQKFDNDNFVISPDTDLKYFRIVATSMQTMRPESQYTKALLNHHEQIVARQKALKIRELIENSENDLPEISLPDVNGDTIRLSSLRGNFILLDYTVLSAEGSENYIQELKKIYNKFHGRGLEIYQVCLDPNKLFWEELVRKYDIKWNCVRDNDALKSRAAANWNIQNIPADYIINPRYEIVGKNLFGRRLEERLQDVMKK